MQHKIKAMLTNCIKRTVSHLQPNFFSAILQRSGGHWTSIPPTAQNSQKN